MDAKTNILENEKLNSDFVRKNINKTEEFIDVLHEPKESFKREWPTAVLITCSVKVAKLPEKSRMFE